MATQDFARVILQVGTDTAEINKAIEELNRQFSSAKGKAKGLKDEIAGVKPTMDTVFVANGVKEVASQMAAATTSAKNLKNETISLTQAEKDLQKANDILNKTTKQTDDIMQGMASKLRQNVNALFQMEQAGLQNTETYRKLLKETARLKDDIGDIKQRINALASDTRLIDGMLGSFQLLASGVQLGQGAMALFGEKSEELQKTFVKLQAVMAITSALQQIQNNLQRESAAMIFLNNVRLKALAATQAVYSFVTNGATVATKAFRLALVSTGIGAVVVGIGYLIGAMSDLGTNTEETSEKLKQFNNELTKLSDISWDKIIKGIDDYDIAVNKLKLATGEITESQYDAMTAITERNAIAVNGVKEVIKTLKDLRKTASEANDVNAVAEIDKNITALQQFGLKGVTTFDGVINTLERYKGTLPVVTDEINALILQITANEKENEARRITEQKKANKERAEAAKKVALDRFKTEQEIEFNRFNFITRSEQEIFDLKQRQAVELLAFQIKNNMLNEQEIRLENSKIIAAEEEFVNKLKEQQSQSNKAFKEEGLKQMREFIKKYKKYKKEQAQIEEELNNKIKSETERHEFSMLDIRDASEREKLLLQKRYAEQRLKDLDKRDKEYKLKYQQIQNELIEIDAKLQKIHKEKMKQLFKDTLQGIVDVSKSLTDVISIFIDRLDKKIELQNERVKEATEIAEKGNVAVLEAEKKRLREATAERQRYVRIQQALLLTETIANSVAAIAKSANLPPPANVFAIISTLAALGTGIAQAQALSRTGFEEGGYTGNKGKKQVAGVVHGGEFVFTKDKTDSNREYFEAIHTGKINLASELRQAKLYRQLISRDRYTLNNGKDDNLLSEIKGLRGDIKGQERMRVSINENGFYAIASKYEINRKRVSKANTLG